MIFDIEDAQSLIFSTPNTVNDPLSISRPAGESGIWQTRCKVFCTGSIPFYHHDFRSITLSLLQITSESECNPLSVWRPGRRKCRSATFSSINPNPVRTIRVHTVSYTHLTL